VELIFAYREGCSPLYRFDPRLKLALLAASSLLVSRLAPAGLAAAAVLSGVLLLLWGPPRKLALRLLISALRFLLLIALLLLLLSAAGPDFPTAAAASSMLVLRLGVWILLGFIFTATTSHTELRGTFYWLTVWIPGFPAAQFALMITVTLGTVPIFFSALRRGRETLASRGGTSVLHPLRTLRALVIPLLTRVFRRSGSLSDALAARGFHNGREFRLPPLSPVQSALTFLLFAGILFMMYLPGLLGYTH
jgi:energy-coupling factor transporter transmembrane protein EcfT